MEYSKGRQQKVLNYVKVIKNVKTSRHFAIPQPTTLKKINVE